MNLIWWRSKLLLAPSSPTWMQQADGHYSSAPRLSTLDSVGVSGVRLLHGCLGGYYCNQSLCTRVIWLTLYFAVVVCLRALFCYCSCTVIIIKCSSIFAGWSSLLLIGVLLPGVLLLCFNMVFDLLKVGINRGITALLTQSNKGRMALTFLLSFLFVIRLVRHWPFRGPWSAWSI